MPEEERVRISSELRRIQSDLAFYSAWLRTESPHVHRSFYELLGQVRQIAGIAMHEAWLEPAVEGDSEMNMPDLGLSALRPYESAYLNEVVDHLSFGPVGFVGSFDGRITRKHEPVVQTPNSGTAKFTS